MNDNVHRGEKTNVPARTRSQFAMSPDFFVLMLLAVDGLWLVFEPFKWLPKGWTVLMAIATVGAGLAILSLWFMASLLFRRLFQFRLRSLLLLVVVIAMPFSWLAVERRRAKQQEEDVEAIRVQGGEVIYDYDSTAWANTAPRPVLSRPQWSRRALGDDFFADVAGVSMGGMPDFGTYDFYCGKGTDAVLARIRRFTELRFLDLSYSRITDAGLENLAQLRKIELLRLTGTPVTDIGLKNLAPMAELTSLELRGTGLTDRGTQRLPWTKKLKTLDLGCTKITEASLRHLARLDGLVSLRLDSIPVTDAGLEQLHYLRQIEKLNLSCTKVTDAGLRHLAGMTHLRELAVLRTSVTDAGLQHLAHLKKLERLDLGWCEITGRGLEHVESLTALRELNLSHTSVNDESLARLKRLTQLTRIDARVPGDQPQARHCPTQPCRERNTRAPVVRPNEGNEARPEGRQEVAVP